MRRVRLLALATAAAVAAAPLSARAAVVVPSARASAPEGAVVTGVSIVPGTGRADVVIAVSGEVRVQDFTLLSPHRVVIDISGARLGGSLAAYDHVSRAGITNVRASQYRANIVRIVLDLDAPRAYSVSRGDAEVRVAVPGAGSFAVWHTGSTAEATGEVRTDTVPERRDAAVPAVVAPQRAPALRQPAVRDDDASPQRAAAIAAPRQDARRQARQQPRMTVTYTDTDIRDVLAGIATFAGRTIIAGKDVQGTVTAEIKDLPWDVAMRAILSAQGLAASEDSTGVITIDSFQNILVRQSSEPLATRVVAVNYASAFSLAETLRGLLSKECPNGSTAPAGGGGQSQSGSSSPSGGVCVVRGSVQSDSSTNQLLVSEVTSRMPALLDYVKSLDVRTPQVSLKARIISVNRTKTDQLGIAYDLGSKDAFFNTLAPRANADGTAPTFESEVLLGGEALAGIANATRKYKAGAALNLIFSAALGKYSITSFIDALRETNLADVQAEPSIVTLDNREAEILVGQEVPIRVIDAGSAGVVGAPARATVQFREIGIILRVTPHVTSNRQIRMRVHAEQSRLNIVGGDLGFFTDKNRADNQLLVNDGETAVIGGLTQTTVTKNKSGIPFLSELPLIGRLFSQTSTQEQKQDLLILITPHVLDEGEIVRPPSPRR